MKITIFTQRRERTHPTPSLCNTHKIWNTMKQRCGNPNNQSYKYYGGRGITVCKEWKESYQQFLSDMGERPFNFQIDRINNELGYCKENCRWVPQSVNARNTRNCLEVRLKMFLNSLR